MSRGVFRGNNYKPKTWSFDTNDTSFSPELVMSFGAGTYKRPLWKLPGGDYYGTGLLSYTFPNSTGKTINVDMNSYDDVNRIKLIGDGVTGHLDLTPFTNLNWVETRACSDLTGVTFSDNAITVLDTRLCNLTGTLDLTTLPNLGNFIRVGDNPNLNHVIHTASTNVFNYYDVGGADLIGNHDVSMLPKQNGVFFVNDNTNLTGITFSPNTGYTITNMNFSSAGIVGELDLSILSFEGILSFSNMPSLTSLKFPTPSDIGDVSGVFTSMIGQNSTNLTGNFDLTMFTQLGGGFNMSNCNFTGVTHTASTQNFTSYVVNSNNLTGTHDLTMLPNLGGTIDLSDNANLNYIIHTASTISITSYLADGCDLLGNHDISMLQGLSRYVQLHGNSSLTGVTFPYSTNTFYNINATDVGKCLKLNSCDLGYINFLPLSGATMDSASTYGVTIDLQNNNMTAGEVNHILTDFNNLSSNLSPNSWSGVTLLINGNTQPDSSSGGYDGLAALASLTGGTNQWTITTTLYE